MPTVSVAKASACIVSTAVPFLLAATSSSLANLTVEFTSTPREAAAAVAPVTRVEAMRLKSVSTLVTDLSILFSFLSVAVSLLSSFCVLASSKTISFSVAIV